MDDARHTGRSEAPEGPAPASDVAHAHQQRLKAAGLRVTGPRMAVLAVLESVPHLGAEAIVRQVRERLGTVSTQAVYDVLATLTAAGLARRIEPAGSPALYELRVADNHHHIVCRLCGAVADVDCVVGRAPCLSPNDTSGYVIDEAEVTFWGHCPACAATATESGASEIGRPRPLIDRPDADPKNLVARPSSESPQASSLPSASPHAASSMSLPPQSISPRAASPETGSPRAGSALSVSPESGSLRAGSALSVSPESVSPRVASPESGSPRAGSPRALSPQSVSPRITSPQTAVDITAVHQQKE